MKEGFNSLIMAGIRGAGRGLKDSVSSTVSDGRQAWKTDHQAILPAGGGLKGALKGALKDHVHRELNSFRGVNARRVLREGAKGTLIGFVDGISTESKAKIKNKFNPK
jgi:hypothetical protein